MTDPAQRQAEIEMGIEHADGKTWWHEAPLPPRWHRCRPWTTSWRLGVERCACGSVRHMGDRFWLEKNSTRKMSRKA